MVDKHAQTAAKHILEDRRGAHYYEDPIELAKYLKNALNLSDTVAMQTANDINEDRTGANYYRDETVLASFLDGLLTVTDVTQ